MKLLTFSKNDTFHLGIQTEFGVLDVVEAVKQLSPAFTVPATVHEAINGGAAATDAFLTSLILF